jgi:hypothetical protein
MNRAILLLSLGFVYCAGSVGWQSLAGMHAPMYAAASVEVHRRGYTGDAICTSCHQKEGQSYAATAHHLTSQFPKDDFVTGFRDAESNLLMIVDPANANIEKPGLYFNMERRGSAFYETATTGWPGHLSSQSARIDIVIGSGKRGLTYLSWRGDELFQLPVTYWVDGKQWINSPGFRDGEANFTRPIFPRCLECHAAYIKSLSDDPSSNRYNKSTLKVGIGCETCHGPGAQHVALRRVPNRAAGQNGQSILNPAHFSRDRQVDLCGFCHNGIRRQGIAPPFSYVPGEPLDDYLEPNTSEVVELPDVHGNQVGLLKHSRCYLSSPKMTCSACHDVHAPEKTIEFYSGRCLTCHRMESCGEFKRMGDKIADNCIDCHMPVEETKKIVSTTAGHVVRATMRSHWIKIYR